MTENKKSARGWGGGQKNATGRRKNSVYKNDRRGVIKS